MSLYNEASLVMVPSAYKDQKVYSVKPFDGTGDLTFTRSNDTASRVASDGLIQKVRTNVFSFSEDFSTSSGFFAGVTGASTATFTANYGTAPDGTATADRIQLELNGEPYADWLRPFAVTTGVGYTYSIYLKSLSGTPTIEFLNDGSVGIQKTLTTDWVRYDYTWTSAGATIYPRFLLGAATSSSADILAWGAMVEVSDFGPTDYIATTSAAVSVGPVANLPRLDYSGGATCPSLLLEPQRTNLATYSEQFDNAAWYEASGIAVTANAAVSPDGYTNADLIYGATSGSISSVQQNTGAAAVATYTNSIFVKYSGKQWFFIFELNGNNGGNFFDIQNGVLGTQNFGSGAFITSYGNGWYRVGFTQSLTSGNLYAIYGVSNANDSFTNTADGTNGALIWGAQLEQGSYATSYIPTLSAAVTRGADFANKGSISSLFGATEGTFFCELTFTNTNSIPIFLQSSVSGSFNQATYIQLGGNKVLYNVYSGGAQQVGITSTSNFTEGQSLKIAIVYKAGDFAMYINGVAEGSVSYGSISNSLTAIQIGRWADGGATFQYFGRLNQALLFPTRLSNADLATLTA